MRICITNDDGIHGEGLLVLANWAKKLGDVTIFAPKTQQSGKAHSIELHQAFEVQRLDTNAVLLHRCISIMPTTNDRTDWKAFQQLP